MRGSGYIGTVSGVCRARVWGGYKKGLTMEVRRVRTCVVRIGVQGRVWQERRELRRRGRLSK